MLTSRASEGTGVIIKKKPRSLLSAKECWQNTHRTLVVKTVIQRQYHLAAYSRVGQCRMKIKEKGKGMRKNAIRFDDEDDDGSCNGYDNNDKRGTRETGKGVISLLTFQRNP